MSLDQTIWVGPYVIARGPRYVGPHAPFDEWLLEVGQEVWSRADNSTGPLVEGAAVYIPNDRHRHELGVHLHPYEPLEPAEIPGQDVVDAFLELYSEPFRKLTADYRSVEVKLGILSYVW